eukprot:8115154-Pyramimonas_sp.AAC.1
MAHMQCEARMWPQGRWPRASDILFLDEHEQAISYQSGSTKHKRLEYIVTLPSVPHKSKANQAVHRIEKPTLNSLLRIALPCLCSTTVQQYNSTEIRIVYPRTLKSRSESYNTA